MKNHLNCTKSRIMIICKNCDCNCYNNNMLTLDLHDNTENVNVQINDNEILNNSRQCGNKPHLITTLKYAITT